MRILCSLFVFWFLFPFQSVFALSPMAGVDDLGRISTVRTNNSGVLKSEISNTASLSLSVGSMSVTLPHVGPTSFATDPAFVSVTNPSSFTLNSVGPTSFATDPAYIVVINPASFPAHVGPTGFSTDTMNITDLTDYAPVLLTATESIISVNPNTVTALTFANNIHGIWVNSFGGVALIGRSTNLATGSIYRGIPIASGSGVKWEWNKPTTTPNIGLIMNGGVTGTCTISAW